MNKRKVSFMNCLVYYFIVKFSYMHFVGDPDSKRVPLGRGRWGSESLLGEVEEGVST